jgi:hypothetical protein
MRNRPDKPALHLQVSCIVKELSFAPHFPLRSRIGFRFSFDPASGSRGPPKRRLPELARSGGGRGLLGPGHWGASGEATEESQGSQGGALLQQPPPPPIHAQHRASHPGHGLGHPQRPHRAQDLHEARPQRKAGQDPHPPLPPLPHGRVHSISPCGPKVQGPAAYGSCNCAPIHTRRSFSPSTSGSSA